MAECLGASRHCGSVSRLRCKARYRAYHKYFPPVASECTRLMAPIRWWEYPSQNQTMIPFIVQSVEIQRSGGLSVEPVHAVPSF